MKRNRSNRKWLLVIPLLLTAAFFIYFLDGYRGDEKALEAMKSDEVKISETDYGWLFDGPSENCALIFYQGGKVDEKAYAPLLHGIASQGIDVCLVDSLFDFPFFNMNGAGKVMSEYDYEYWYIGGHSLGGVVASYYLSSHPEGFRGLVLLASYASKQIPDGIRQIVIYGSNDKVLDFEDVYKARELSSGDYEEYIIEGGNHCQFGSYGFQKGDGEADITAERQIDETAEIILEEFIID